MQVRQSLVVIPACLLLFSVISCGGGSGDAPTQPDPTPTSGFTQSGDLIANVAGIMRNSAAQTNASVAALNTSVNAYCATVTTSSAGDPAQRTDAQDAFKAAMNDVQRSTMHAIGPALENDLLRQIYSWPITSHCGIDQKLADNKTALNLAINRRGLDALEYLLFVEPTTGHACPSGTQPESDLAAFNALSAADRQVLRCDFMKNVALDATANAKIFADAWNPAIGNYVATMTGTTNTTKTLNEITDAMYVFREVVREFKLDKPLGSETTKTPPSCGEGQLCPQDVESPTAKISKENIRANTLAFQALYWGGSSTAAVGFDDWLTEQGKADVAEKLEAEIQAVLTKIDGINGSLFDAITNDTNAANALLNATAAVSDTLRFDMLPALGLSIPQALVSDTD